MGRWRNAGRGVSISGMDKWRNGVTVVRSGNEAFVTQLDGAAVEQPETVF